MSKTKILKKKLNYRCRECDTKGVRGTPTPRKQCKRCKGTGIFRDHIYYFIWTDKKGIKHAIDADNLN